MIHRAVQMDPLTSALLPLSKIREMVDNLFAAEAEYLPQFQTKAGANGTKGTNGTKGRAHRNGVRNGVAKPASKNGHAAQTRAASAAGAS
jgi:hypothetical protein